MLLVRKNEHKKLSYSFSKKVTIGFYNLVNSENLSSVRNLKTHNPYPVLKKEKS
jgi:hypothetical protein